MIIIGLEYWGWAKYSNEELLTQGDTCPSHCIVKPYGNRGHAKLINTHKGVTGNARRDSGQEEILQSNENVTTAVDEGWKAYEKEN